MKQILLLAITLAILVYATLPLFVGKATPGYAIQDLGRNHMSPSGIGGCEMQLHHSLPPGSGCHSHMILEYGIYDETQPDKLMIHSLEHGGIFNTYRMSGVDEEDAALVSQLTDLVQELKASDEKYCRLILAPYDVPFSALAVPELEEVAPQMKIALAAWARIDMMPEFDRSRIIKFVDAFINAGPENVSDCR